jgi:hypothetical protein
MIATAFHDRLYDVITYSESLWWWAIPAKSGSCWPLFVRLTATNFVTHKQKVHFLTYTAILWQIVECKIYTEHGNEDIVQNRSLKNCFVKMQAELFFCFHGVSL